MAQQTVSKMERVQTAVEWLEEHLNKWSDGRLYLPPHLFEQAKQMEKEQIVQSIINCAYEYKITYDEAEQYYNETYNTQNK